MSRRKTLIGIRPVLLFMVPRFVRHVKWCNLVQEQIAVLQFRGRRGVCLFCLDIALQILPRDCSIADCCRVVSGWV